MPSSALDLSIGELKSSFANAELSPLEVTETALERASQLDETLHAFVAVCPELALEQAREAAVRFRRGDDAPLLGVPISIKDVFDVAGVETTLGSITRRSIVPRQDSGVVRRLRAAGAVFVGKTNTAEFGQSATTDNLLGQDTCNPWDTRMTAGGSSGGAAASVAAGMVVAAVGSDGGGSIRIPAAFTGVVGLKPTHGRCLDEGGFRGMSAFVSPGPITSRVSDARVMYGVLADTEHKRSEPRPVRVAFCPRPEARPITEGVERSVRRAAELLGDLGHRVDEVALPIDGWEQIFGPLVLEEERRERGALLHTQPAALTAYARLSLVAAEAVDQESVASALRRLADYRARVAALLSRHDVLLTPTTAVPAFPLRRRPTTIAGVPVDTLWGAFPFAVPFNVAGVPAITLPSGLDEGLPVGVQLVAATGCEQQLLDLAEQLEEALGFDPSPVREQWAMIHAVAQ